MKRKPLTAGEIRFRTSKVDRDRLDWLLRYHPNEYRTISELLRALIAREQEALTNVHTLKTKDE